MKYPLFTLKITQHLAGVVGFENVLFKIVSIVERITGKTEK